jgi:ribosomal protein S18 acetylase RimI-like enzyme
MEDNYRFHIRPAIPNDAASIARFFRKNVEDHNELDPYFVLSPNFDIVTFLEQAIKTPNVLVLVAEKKTEIVGYIFLRVSREQRAYTPKSILLRLISRRRRQFGATSMFKPYRVGFISDCFVESSYRKQGAGSLLLAKGLEWLAEQKIAHIELEAYIGNAAAVKFWQSQGFETLKLKMRREVKRSINPS